MCGLSTILDYTHHCSPLLQVIKSFLIWKKCSLKCRPSLLSNFHKNFNKCDWLIIIPPPFSTQSLEEMFKSNNILQSTWKVGKKRSWNNDDYSMSVLGSGNFSTQHFQGSYKKIWPWRQMYKTEITWQISGHGCHRTEADSTYNTIYPFHSSSYFYKWRNSDIIKSPSSGNNDPLSLQPLYVPHISNVA